MSGNEIRKKFLEFFKARGHTIIPSASLVPENDPSVLFNTAGMQPLVPYLMGQPHSTGATRIADSQKCVRTNDIDEVGDNTHLTFFEMLGNWSLGDYFKQEAITWSYEFLTSNDEGLGLDPKRLYVTVFEGDENAPRDEEAYKIWKEIFEGEGLDPDRRIFFMDAESNWWSPGDNGPCGPDSEMFYDVTGNLTAGLTKDEFLAADDRQDVVEIWNDVFMEYEKKDGKVIGKLAAQNVDTGSGLERVTAVVQGKQSVFDTDLFQPLIEVIKSSSAQSIPESERIIADHLRASVFLIADGVSPSNTDQGYILRRLLRRAIRHARKLRMPTILPVAQEVIKHFKEAYPELERRREAIEMEIAEEERNFNTTLEQGMKQFDRIASSTEKVSGEEAFKLFSSHGFPLELTMELAAERGIAIDVDAFNTEMLKHQEQSRAGAEQKFKGGLADHSEKVVQYHTATHLLLAALRKELGDHVHQAGSNITGERLRFDFTHPEKIERSVLDTIEAWVNTAIKNGGAVTTDTRSKTDAQNDPTVEASFWDRYPDMVNVYSITAPDGTLLSRELCGGPHVTDLSEVKGTFRITKEESSSAGVRRIKAVLE
ncbi:MAG: alanine--tRNA ligase [Candidatus Paceibacterota bacterium]